MVETLAASLRAPLAFVLVGLALQALAPRPFERSWWSRLGLAYLLGAAWVGLGAWVSSALLGVGIDRSAFVGVGLIAILVALAVAVRRRSFGGLARSHRSAHRVRPRWPTVLVAIAVAAPTIALLASTTAEVVTDFDGRMTWGTQARYLQAAQSVLPPALVDEHAFVVHPRYPILLPILQVAASELANRSIDGYVVRPIYVLFLPALAAALWPALVRAGGRRGAGLAAALLFTAPIFWRELEGGPRGTYSDLPLGAFLAGALALLLHPRLGRDPWRGAIGGLLLAAAAASKNEGLLLAVAALAAIAWVARRRQRGVRLALGTAALLLVATIALVVAWRSQIPNRNDEAYFESASLATLLANLPDRIGTIAGVVVERSLDLERWGVLFWVLPALVLAGRRGLVRRPVRAALLVLGFQCALAVAAYSVVGDPGIVDVTWNRFVLQVSGANCILLAALIGRLGVLARLRRFRAWTG